MLDTDLFGGYHASTTIFIATITTTTAAPSLYTFVLGVRTACLTTMLATLSVDQIPDAETIAMVYNLLHYEGIFVGASSALNMVGAVKVAEAVGEGNTVGEQHSAYDESCFFRLVVGNHIAQIVI